MRSSILELSIFFGIEISFVEFYFIVINRGYSLVRLQDYFQADGYCEQTRESILFKCFGVADS